MEYADYMRFFFALMFVVGLIGGTAVLARRFGLAPGTATGGRASKKRLEIVESLTLDTKRRMIIVRRDNQEHLILLGTESETIVETSFERPAQLPVEVVETQTPDIPSSAGKPSDDDDIFARLRKVAELMNEKRAQSLRTGRPSPQTPTKAEATSTALRKIAGDRS